jgi:hypothetical protein
MERPPADPQAGRSVVVIDTFVLDAIAIRGGVGS